MRCPVCNKGFEDNLIHCPYCKTDPRLPKPEVSPELVSAVWRKQRSAFFGLGGAITLLIGGSVLGLYSTLRDEIERRLLQKIASEFEQPRIKATVESVASSEAATLIKRSIQPTITTFQGDIEKRLNDFDSFLTTQRDATSAVYEKLRREVDTLHKRNGLTALADAAIGEGSVEAYRLIERIADKRENDPEKIAAMAELFRVFTAYSFAAPNRWTGIEIDAAAVNPKWKKDTELTTEELIRILALKDQPAARARAAELLTKKEPDKSFATADAIVEAIKRETHLDVVKRLRRAFEHVTAHSEPGKLDGREIVEWWRANKSDFAKKKTDPDKP